MSSISESNPSSSEEEGLPHGLPAVEVRATALGYGVFALRKFRREQVIEEIRGQVIDDSEHESDYSIDLGGNLSLEPDAPYRFLNHSCQPNAELFEYADEAGDAPRQMWLSAIRKIRPGDQITIDYCWPASAAIACRCESPRCRGWIVDQSELEAVQRRAKNERKKK